MGKVVMVVLLGLLSSSTAWSKEGGNNVLYGNCFTAKGAKCEATHRITTDFDDGVATIDEEHGTYRLDLNGDADRKVSVYCDGKRLGSVKVEGRTLFTVHCP